MLCPQILHGLTKGKENGSVICLDIIRFMYHWILLISEAYGIVGNIELCKTVIERAGEIECVGEYYK